MPKTQMRYQHRESQIILRRSSTDTPAAYAAAGSFIVASMDTSGSSVLYLVSTATAEYYPPLSARSRSGL